MLSHTSNLRKKPPDVYAKHISHEMLLKTCQSDEDEKSARKLEKKSPSVDLSLSQLKSNAIPLKVPAFTLDGFVLSDETRGMIGSHLLHEQWSTYAECLKCVYAELNSEKNNFVSNKTVTRKKVDRNHPFHRKWNRRWVDYQVRLVVIHR